MDEIEELQAAFAHVVAATNRRDLEAYVASHHDQVVLFPARSPVPIVGKAAVRQRMAVFFAQTASVRLTPINPHFHIVGTTGVVWGPYTMALKPTDGPLRHSFGRLALTFTKVTGQWLIATSTQLTAPVRKLADPGARRRAPRRMVVSSVGGGLDRNGHRG
jgi:ketosteroid isomerase-like protein